MVPFIFIDMNTQRDFLDADGACPVANVHVLRSPLRKVFAFIRSYHISLISSLTTQRANEPPLVPGWPLHCIDGTPGHNKLSFTLLGHRAIIEANNSLDVPLDLFSHYRQVIFRRRSEDFLDNPKADHLLSNLSPECYFLFGVDVERSLKRLALALLARGKVISVIRDACGFWNETDADLAFRLIVAKGGSETTVSQLESRLRLLNSHRTARLLRHARSRR